MRLRTTAFPRVAAAAVVTMVLLGACGGSGGSGSASDGEGSKELIVQAANYDLVAGTPSRFIAGVLMPDQLFVSYGTVDVEFSYLGTRDDRATGEEGPSAEASFLAIEGDPSTEGPIATTASEGRGVYAADVTFDRAGFWAADVTAELDDGAMSGRAMFEVREDNVFPAVGERAPRTENLTIESKDAPREAVDSRARDGEEIPDPELHDMTIAESIRRGEPALVVFSTPVYCVSRFCGPITDMIAGLQRDYGDRANFIHVEVWRDFDETVVNKGAADWIYRQKDLLEPWVYLIDAEGKIAARFDNVATRPELEPLLEKLPRLK